MTGGISDGKPSQTLAISGIQRRSRRKRVVKKSSNDELGLSSKEFNARYRKKQKEEQTKRNTVWWRLKSLQTVMKDHIVAQTFEAGLSLTALNRQILFANPDGAQLEHGDSKTRQSKYGHKRKKTVRIQESLLKEQGSMLKHQARKRLSSGYFRK